MKIKKGIQLIDEVEGIGKAASKGDFLRFNIRAFLRKGEEIPINTIEDRAAWPEGSITKAGGAEFINFSSRLGRRDNIAAVEYTLHGMKAGGYRKIKASPHLAYGKEGVPGKVPKNAVIVFEIWLRELVTPNRVRDGL
ncbi:MAG: FKBP-type peptidyl-prolyl cis-trans isomerase [Syntrophorhabdus sp. PtaU1.Bin002]|nr:MAG: FKBP-type peptidyl-prolyl cis-trans isomerase [Syntrophorhabdus sp. PtaU1.Bin002]